MGNSQEAQNWRTDQRPATSTTTPIALGVILILVSIFESGLSILSFVGTWLAYPSGFLGDISPTTAEDVSQSLVTAIVFGLLLIFSFLCIKYIKFLSELYCAVRLTVYFYIVFNVVGTLLSYPSETLPLGANQIPLFLFGAVLLCAPTLYCLLLAALIVYNYRLLRANQK